MPLIYLASTGTSRLIKTTLSANGEALPEASSYRIEIDGLRALAVVAVIIHHFENWLLPSGYLGVDIFFVISGYVITASLAGRRADGLKDFLLQFYTRRIKRLAPALIFYTAAIGVLICLFERSPIASLRTGAASLFGLSNLYILKQASDYFGSAAELNAFTHTWSLGVEEQFYLLFPCLVWFFNGRPALGSAPKLVAAVMVLAAASLAGFVYFSGANHPVAFFSMPTRFWELGCGCALLLCESHYPRMAAALRRIPPLPVAIALVAVLFSPLDFAVAATIAAVALTVLLLACLRPAALGYNLFTMAPVTYVGRISYSLYLWHWGVLVLSRWTIGIHWWSVGFQVAVMLVMAMVSYHLVEAPLRRAVWSTNRWLEIANGLAASLFVAGGLIFLQAGASASLFSGTLSPQHKYAEAGAPPNSVGAQKSGTLLLIGDSHAGHLDELGRRAAARLGMAYKIVSNGATPFPIARFSTPVGGLTYARTEANGDNMQLGVSAALADLAPDQRHLIVLSSFYRFYWDTPTGNRRFQVLSHFDSFRKPISRAESFERWLADLEQFARTNQSRKIVLILSTPEMPGIYPTELCTPQWFRPWIDDSCAKSMSLHEVKEKLDGLNSKIAEVASRTENVVVFDPVPSLCTGHECPSHSGGTRLYGDEDHLTPEGAARVEKDFVEFLRTRGFELAMTKQET